MRKSTAVAASIAAVAGIIVGGAAVATFAPEPEPERVTITVEDTDRVDSCQALAFNLSGGYGGMLAAARAGEPIDADTFARNYSDKAIPLADACGLSLAY